MPMIETSVQPHAIAVQDVQDWYADLGETITTDKAAELLTNNRNRLLECLSLAAQNFIKDIAPEYAESDLSPNATKG